MVVKGYDFSGWATKNDIRCSDGVTIKQDAFAGNNGTRVPLVWQHNYSSPKNVLGTVLLQNASDGVYAFGFLNNSDEAKNAKEAIKHGDINAMSIGARGIQKHGQDVIHGSIYEVSLVLAGANPGAVIDFAMQHSAYGDEEDQSNAIIQTGMLIHSSEDEYIQEDNTLEGENLAQAAKVTPPANNSGSSDGEQTIGEVLDTLSPLQQSAVEALVANIQAEYEGDDGSDGDGEDSEGPADQQEDTTKQSVNLEGEHILKHNAFDEASGKQEEIKSAGFYSEDGTLLTHADANVVLHGAIKHRATSLNEVLMANGFASKSEEDLEHGLTLTHGLTNVEVLFPATTLTKGIQTFDPKGFNVPKILGMISTSPMSRIKNIFANMTEDDARARGYLKGNQKWDSFEQVFFRETTPGTVMRRTRFDRDDMIDIEENGIDILTYIQTVQQAKLQQEIVRAAILGDGRPNTITSDGSTIRNPDKIDPGHIRPIFTDDPLFTIPVTVSSFSTFPQQVTTAMAFYQGSGSPVALMNSIDIAKLRNLQDGNGRPFFGGYNGTLPGADVIANYFGWSAIIEYREMAPGQILVGNLGDYVIGASKGGQIANFEFFDIDFNAQKYLVETRISGAIQTPKSFLAITVTDPGSTDDSGFNFVTTGVNSASSWTVDTGTVPASSASSSAASSAGSSSDSSSASSAG